MTKPASYRFGPRQFSDQKLFDDQMRQLREEELAMRAPHDGLKRIRKRHDKSQAEMAEIMRISRRTYQDFEAGKRAIPSDAILHLHSAFDCDLHELFTGLPVPIPRDVRAGFVKASLDAVIALLVRYGEEEDKISATDLRRYATLTAELTPPGDEPEIMWLLEMVARERAGLPSHGFEEDYDENKIQE